MQVLAVGKRLVLDLGLELVLEMAQEPEVAVGQASVGVGHFAPHARPPERADLAHLERRCPSGRAVLRLVGKAALLELALALEPALGLARPQVDQRPHQPPEAGLEVAPRLP